jgi:hypothetical protein
MRSLTLIAAFLLCLTVLANAQTAFDENAAIQDPQAKIQLFPNPASDYLHVKLDGVRVINFEIVVRNIIGNEIKTEVEFIGDNEFRLRVRDFTIGYYLLALRDEDSNFKGTYKFVKR